MCAHGQRFDRDTKGVGRGGRRFDGGVGGDAARCGLSGVPFSLAGGVDYSNDGAIGRKLRGCLGCRRGFVLAVVYSFGRGFSLLRFA